MSRTTIFLVAAAALGVVALLANGPRLNRSPSGSGQSAAVATEGSLSVSARLSHPFVRRGTNQVFVSAELSGTSTATQHRSPVNLALVIDRSGSMSGNKLAQAKLAARQLITQLEPTDSLALVHYGSDVKAFALLQATDDNKRTMQGWVDGIWDDGGTNISAGLAAGRAALAGARNREAINRIILVSDGQPTEGETSMPGLTQVVRDIRSAGISVSSIGVGDDFNEQLMAGLAEVGSGAYAYLHDASQLASIFQRDLDAAGTQVARDVVLTFRTPRGVKIARVLGYSNLARRDDGSFEELRASMPNFAAGQRDRVTAELTLEAADSGTLEAVEVGVEYFDTLASRVATGRLALSTTVTEDQRIVDERRDVDTLVFATRAQAAENTSLAATALRENRPQDAARYLEASGSLFEALRGAVGDEAVAADLQAQRELKESAASARPAAASKELHKKSLINFGKTSSTY